MIASDRGWTFTRSVLATTTTLLVIGIAIALSLHAAATSSLSWFIASIGVMIFGCEFVDRVLRKRPPPEL